jgi:hypothetical protein
MQRVQAAQLVGDVHPPSLIPKLQEQHAWRRRVMKRERGREFIVYF